MEVHRWWSLSFLGAASYSRRSYNDEKGFGFIEPDDGGEDLFVHRRDVRDGDEIRRGDAVRFESEYDDRKGKSPQSASARSKLN